MKKILLLLTVLLFTISCGKKETGDSEKKDQTLTFYAGLQEDHAAMVAKEFEKETGIKTNFVRMSSGEVLARLKAEKNNMSASVWYGGPVDAFVAAKEADLIEPYISPEAANIKDGLKDTEGYWTGIYVGYLGFVGNQKMLDEKGLKMPASWADLLKPEYKGEIVVAHPGSSGTAYTMLATLVQLMGEDEAMEYLKKFNGQVRQYTKSGTAPGRMAGQGETTIGITFLHDAIKYKKEGYKDIVISAPSEGTGYEIGGVALLKNGPDQEAAKKFIDWVLTKKVQEMGKTVGSFQFLTNKDAMPPAEADPIKDTKLIKYDFDWAGKNRIRLVERFSTETSTTAPTK
ncbi:MULTISPECIES: ABC transporter substrate-binding protein [Psychrilyobacter]|uniref:Extracellular solute-binding protein n=1 Tax=Psychrilyobacter piezotolerans TaxID=2293438 RepID=A0ABX9KJF3_9FUSO|nr:MULTISPECIES: ABC transporter substrate-binding protein [Psychrilyobacter]MCS5422770.1 ABC transporter substrate-binding protein [Psychrilyobacter sp. S5]NDI76930.1 ABC transporter substrate-binding protein [Psychrilyobacter piezotolerans]RDE64554.1 extracellular solute-binding protein [Psychrilyobacter sp. S5]REI42366.1 extracellular solute-binding protein [Psychrilyobacter piezotolerans]